MAKPILDDGLWAIIKPLLPEPKPRPYGHPGRKPLDNRLVLTGILFVLKTGIPWEDLPQEMGCGSGMTCWRRLRDWHLAGVWQKLHEALLATLQGAGQLDWSRAVVDSAFVRAIGGGGKNRPQPSGPTQTRQQASRDYRRPGSATGRGTHRRKPARRYATSSAG